MKTSIAFITYETPFAPCGGVAAVMGRLPLQVQSASGIETIVITPCHHHLPKTAAVSGRATRAGSVSVPLGPQKVCVEVLRFVENGIWYFLKPERDDLFAGRRHPYDVSPDQLLRDVLFFASAAAQSLSILDSETSWKLLLQDWEAAPVALAAAGENLQYQCFLTLHNSYDRFVTAADLFQAGINPAVSPGGTILQRALNLIAGPVFTVSSQYAVDLLEDVVQTSVLAPHLQEPLRNRVLGIDNGPFAACGIDAELRTDMHQGGYGLLQEWKKQKQQEALQALTSLAPEGSTCWGSPDVFRRHEAPWFVMAGRDDPRQKGYEVAAAAAAEFLEAGGDAQFLFFPIPGDEGLAGLRFLVHLAERFPGRVLVAAARLRDGFSAALQGAAFGLMPSFYEPFGMVHEFAFSGTIGIGRATGGIVEQIVPWRAASSCSAAVQRRAERWHSLSARPTGILFRESDAAGSRREDWAALNAGGYRVDEAGTGRLAQRQELPLFRAMVRELHAAMRDGVELVTGRPSLYSRMVAEGIDYIERTFSWERAAQEYVRHVL